MGRGLRRKGWTEALPRHAGAGFAGSVLVLKVAAEEACRIYALFRLLGARDSLEFIGRLAEEDGLGARSRGVGLVALMFCL